MLIPAQRPVLKPRFRPGADLTYPVSAPDGAMGSAKSFRLIASPADTTLARHCSRRAANGLSLLVVARRAPSRPDPLALS